MPLSQKPTAGSETPKAFLHRLTSFDAVRFDEDLYYYNHPGHPLAGSLYYLIGRSNGLGMWPSPAFAFAGSGIWEVLIEFREVISINDMIPTPLPGMAVGEVQFQFSKFFSRAKPYPWNILASWLIGGPTTLNQLLNGTLPDRATHFGRFGLPDDVFHDFRFSLQGGVTVDHASGIARPQIGANLKGRIINIPEYGRPGESSRLSERSNLGRRRAGILGRTRRNAKRPLINESRPRGLLSPKHRARGLRKVRDRKTALPRRG